MRHKNKILHWAKSNLAGAKPKRHDITLGKLEIPRGQLGQKNNMLEASLYKDTHSSRQIKKLSIGNDRKSPACFSTHAGGGGGRNNKGRIDSREIMILGK